MRLGKEAKSWRWRAMAGLAGSFLAMLPVPPRPVV